jgi:hypothetical protein
MTTTQSTPASSRLSAELEALRARTQGQSLTLGELHRALDARGPALLLLLLALPFCVIAIPGLSTPFGLAIGLIGACLALGREPRLPRFFLQRRLPPERAGPLLAGAAPAWPAGWKGRFGRAGRSCMQGQVWRGWPV